MLTSVCDGFLHILKSMQVLFLWMKRWKTVK